MAFLPDGRRAVTASQDHSLRIWKLDVRYAQQEDPKCIVKADQQVTSVPSPPITVLDIGLSWGRLV